MRYTYSTDRYVVSVSFSWTKKGKNDQRRISSNGQAVKFRELGQGELRDKRKVFLHKGLYSRRKV